MKQQINLYQSELRPRSEPFSVVSIAWLFLVFLGALAVFYAYGTMRLNRVETAMYSIDDELQQLRGQLEVLVRQFPEKSESKLLTTEIARLNRELDRRRAISRALEKHSLENSRGFSDLLESLARQHVQGTWLTHVSIADGGESFSFAGHTWSSELVPAYIRQLSEEKPFKGLAFNVLEMQRGEEGKGDLLFEVRTREEKM